MDLFRKKQGIFLTYYVSGIFILPLSVTLLSVKIWEYILACPVLTRKYISRFVTQGFFLKIWNVDLRERRKTNSNHNKLLLSPYGRKRQKEPLLTMVLLLQISHVYSKLLMFLWQMDKYLEVNTWCYVYIKMKQTTISRRLMISRVWKNGSPVSVCLRSLWICTRNR